MLRWVGGKVGYMVAEGIRSCSQCVFVCIGRGAVVDGVCYLKVSCHVFR